MLLTHKEEHLWVGSKNLEPNVQSEANQKEKNTYINAYMWNLERWRRWTHLQGSSGDTDVENRLVDTVQEGEGGTNWKSNMET